MRPVKRHTSIPIIALSVLLILTVLCVSIEFISKKSSVTVTILQTSDIHGMINPYNYIDNRETSYGMARIAAVIAEERAKDPELLLIDTGDLTRGNYIQELRSESIHPAIDALNFLHYDAWTPGNHEFNYEYEALENEISAFNGKILLGNAYTEDGSRWQKAWEIFQVKGVRVAIFGITAPHIPQWEEEDSSHYNDMSFTEPIEETGKILDELEGKADVIIGSIHYGLDGKYGSVGVQAIAEAYSDRLDGLLIGHSHEKVNTNICGVPILQPYHDGRYVSKLTVRVEKENGVWVVNKHKTGGMLIDVSSEDADEDFLEHFKELHVKSLALAQENH